MLKYIIAIILVILAWVAWFMLDQGGSFWWAPVGFTVLVVAVLLAIVVARRLRARRAARELEKALAAQAAEQARSARPDMQAELLQMQQEFQRAIAALKGSRLARGGENALYSLPWYVIIGPPGAGKTTALRNSGLQFPYMSRSGELKGVGGTRNCDWWLTNEGVLLDTAGRWTSEDDDRDEWLQFLDLLKKYRSEKPLNGIVVALSVGDIGGAHEEEVAALARRTRERVDEVQNRLQLSLPVYVLFTKADLIPGFVETFNDLSKNDRGQVWGFTAPITQGVVDARSHFTERFDEMAGIVERRAMRRMGEERKIETRELIHTFPQQLTFLRQNCSAFLGQLFEPSVYGATPVIRGVYFSSGTQEGRPIDRVMHKMAEAFGIRSEVNLGEPVTEAKSYFLRDVFLKVVFPDLEIASRSEAEESRQRRGRVIAAGAIFATAMLIAALPALAWVKNRAYLGSTNDIVSEVYHAAEGAGPMQPQSLTPLQARVDELRGYDRVGAPVYMRLGLYQDDVYPVVRDYYTRILQNEVVAPIQQAQTDQLDAFGRRYEAARESIPSGPEHTTNYDRLKLHLLLTRPLEQSQPQLGETEAMRTWLSHEIVRYWVERLGGERQVDDPTHQQMEQHANLFASLLGDRDQQNDEYAPDTNDLRFPRRPDVVNRARQALTRVPASEMALERVIQDCEPLHYDMRLQDLIGNTVAGPGHLMRCERREPTPDGRALVTECHVRSAFTRRAWDDRVRDMLTSSDTNVFGESWVLGQEVQRPDPHQREHDLRNLRNQYFTAYIEEWREFLRDIRLFPADENAEILVDLQDLTRGTPQPHRLLFEQVLRNTTLPPPPPSAAEQLAQSNWFTTWLSNRANQLRGGSTAQRLAQQVTDPDHPMQGSAADEELDPAHVFLTFEGFTSFGAVNPPPPPAAPAAGQAPPPPPPAPTLPIASYESQLGTVRDALTTYLDNPQGTDEALTTSLQTARTATRALIASQMVGWRPRFEALLWPPIEGTARSTAVAQARGAGRSWCNEVYMPYSHNIMGGYPLNPGGHDIPLPDFASFYKPGTGTLWGFYDATLRRRIPHEGEQFSFATNTGQAAASAYRGELLPYLEAAQDITSTFFPPGSDAPQVQFDVRVRPSVRVATQNFCSGGHCIEAHNGPEEWQRFAWPGEAPVAGASLEVRGEGGIHERIEQTGEWGLFRLLEQGTVSSVSNGRRIFTITWRLRDHEIDVSIDFRPVRGDAPFFGVAGRERNPPLFQPLRTEHDEPPREIANGGTTCPPH